MVQIGAFDAKTHLPALLKRVAHGEVVQITRRGVPVAQLVPVESSSKVSPREAARSIRMGRRGVRLGGISIRALIDEGRR
jgi:prevent-host-death family protein